VTTSPNRDELLDWLLQDGRRCNDVPSLLEELLPRLRNAAPVDRMFVGTTVLHPQAAAYAWIWEDGADRLARLTFTREDMERFEGVDNPMARLRLGAQSLRFRHGEGTSMNDLTGLWRRGFHDFLGESLWLRGQWAGGFTFATRRPALSAVIEPLTRDAMYGTLLRTYLGADAGRRVAAGQVRRGDGQPMEAAIWFCDVRGFTTLSQQVPQDVLLALLDDVFQAVVEAVRARGGEVLKFLGDGALAIFRPDACGGAEGACTAATQAADDLQRALIALRARRATSGCPQPHVGIGLHFGELTYGNIGAPTRLDFTVIGASVNVAARVEELCALLGEEVLATTTFAERGEGWVSAGAHAVKGLPAPLQVYRRA
jgi:adenylate cyclase